VELVEDMLFAEVVDLWVVGCGVMVRLIVCWRWCLIGLVDLW
jgi:hypothetical protein